MLRARESCVCEAIRGGDGFEPLLELLVGEILVSPLGQRFIDLALKPFPKLHGAEETVGIEAFVGEREREEEEDEEGEGRASVSVSVSVSVSGL